MPAAPAELPFGVNIERARRDAEAMFDPVIAGQAIDKRLRETLDDDDRLRSESDRVA